MKWWKEHFSEVLSSEQPANPVGEDLGRVIEEEVEIDESEIKITEVREAIRRMKNGKASGADKVVAEMIKADIETSEIELTKLFNHIWQKEEIPNNWKKGIIVKIPKKGDIKECKNWRGVTLLPVISKIFGRVVINRIKKGVDKILRKEQAGFREKRGTTEQIFILRNIIIIRTSKRMESNHIHTFR